MMMPCPKEGAHSAYAGKIAETGRKNKGARQTEKRKAPEKQGLFVKLNAKIQSGEQKKPARRKT